MHEEQIKLLRESGEPEKLVIAKLIEAGFSTAIEQTMDYCRAEGISPTNYARGLMSMFTMEIAAFCIPQGENATDLSALFVRLFAANLATYVTQPKKGDGHD